MTASVPSTAPTATQRGYFSLHTHSRFSVNDAMSDVEDLVRQASLWGQPALGLTDHGSPAGWVQLYKSAKKYGIKPLPGIELYVARDRKGPDARSTAHLTIAAYTEQGYRNLTALATHTARSYYFKPVVDLPDFAEMHEAGLTEGLVVGTGCYFGLTAKTLRDQGPRAARQVVSTLVRWFPKVYVELHNHGVSHDPEFDPEYPNDDAVVEAMVKIAHQLGLPTIVANDSHYTRREDQPLHNELKTLISWSSDPADAVFPGGPYSLLSEQDMREYFPARIANPAFDALAELAEESSVRIPELDTFSLQCPDVSLHGDPLQEIEDKCVRRLQELGYLDTFDEHYERLATELAVIKASGFAGMILLVSTVTDFMLEQGISFYARGSASNALVCYLLQITQVHPIDWDLNMERFLSKDRTKPPDIDLDVEHDRRAEVEDFLRSKFAVVQVGTSRLYGINNDEQDEEADTKGSLLVRYYSVRRKHDPHATKLQWSDVPEHDREVLTALADMDLIAGYGTHAAGFVVAPTEASLARLPKAYIASSRTTITAFGMKDVEALGYVKIDLLGLKDPTGMRYALEMVGKTAADIPMPKPWEKMDPKIIALMSRGDTDGLFQFKGWTMKKNVRRLKPRTLEDLAAAVALFRPATMNSGATERYLARRKGEEETPRRHADIHTVTDYTYGVLLYQEQVIQVLGLLGMDSDELTEMLAAVKASNKYTAGALVKINEALPRIKDLGVARGWNDEDIEWLVGSLGAYADYSFNKGHSAAYAERAYQSAWMSVYEPQAFWAGMLRAFDGSKMVKLFLTWTREHRIDMLPVSVNRSSASYKRDGNGVRRGLQSISGVGAVASAEIERYQPYESLSDLARKVLPKKVSGAANLAKGMHPKDCTGIITLLYGAGALDDFLDEMEARR